jgi:hypothetical protein
MRSSRALIFAGSILLLGSLSIGQTGNRTPPIDLDSPIVQTDSPVTRDCKEADWSLLETPAAKDLLSDYDFDPFLPGQCKAVDVKWLPSVQILRLDAATTGVDDFREITLLRASSNSRLWLIPILHGLVGYQDTPGNPHNLAAFNDLLRVAKLKVTDGNLWEVSDLYQFLVGMPVKSNPHPPRTLKDAMSVNDIAGSIEHGDGFTDFTHREKFGDTWSSQYMVWEFRYITSGEFGRLVDVERKTLKQLNASK